MQTDGWSYAKRSRWSYARPSVPRPRREFNVLAAVLIVICVVAIASRL